MRWGHQQEREMADSKLGWRWLKRLIDTLTMVNGQVPVKKV